MKKHHFNISKREFIDFQNGCEVAFRAIYDQYHLLLYTYVYSTNRSEYLAEEVVQEAFINLFKNRKNLENRRGIYPYLFVSVKRLIIMRFRKEVIRSRYNNYLHLNWTEETESVEEVVHLKELNGFINTCIDELPRRQKEIYTLNKKEGLSYKEIAARLDVSVHTVKNQLISASKNLRIKIKRYYSVLICFFFFFH